MIGNYIKIYIKVKFVKNSILDDTRSSHVLKVGIIKQIFILFPVYDSQSSWLDTQDNNVLSIVKIKKLFQISVLTL